MWLALLFAVSSTSFPLGAITTADEQMNKSPSKHGREDLARMQRGARGVLFRRSWLNRSGIVGGWYIVMLLYCCGCCTARITTSVTASIYSHFSPALGRTIHQPARRLPDVPASPAIREPLETLAFTSSQIRLQLYAKLPSNNLQASVLVKATIEIYPFINHCLPWLSSSKLSAMPLHHQSHRIP